MAPWISGGYGPPPQRSPDWPPTKDRSIFIWLLPSAYSKRTLSCAPNTSNVVPRIAPGGSGLLLRDCVLAPPIRLIILVSFIIQSNAPTVVFFSPSSPLFLCLLAYLFARRYAFGGTNLSLHSFASSPSPFWRIEYFPL